VFVNFHLFPPSLIVISQGIFVAEEDVLYNWTSKDSMVISALSVPIRGAKEIHALNLQAFVEVCSPLDSFIIHLDFAIGEPHHFSICLMFNFPIFVIC
jgi:hypothetical protein